VLARTDRDVRARAHGPGVLTCRDKRVAPPSVGVPVAAAVLASIVLVAISVVQIAGAAGRPVGRFVWGAQHEVVLPRGLRIDSAVSVVVYAGMAAALIARGTGREGALIVIAWVLGRCPQRAAAPRRTCCTAPPP
jgi:hypothetical protein